MLKDRVITAVIIAIVGFGAVFFAPPVLFAVLAMAVVLLVGGWEATRLAKITTPAWVVLYIAAVTTIGGLLWWQAGMQWSGAWLGVVALAWIGPLYWLRHPTNQRATGWVAVFLGGLLTGTWLSLVLLQSINPWLIVWVIAIIAGADIGAYFAGRAFGGAKLAPNISPKKTWAGVYGGVLAAMVLAPVAQAVLPVGYQVSWAWLAALGLALAAISIVGDLTISLLKRQAGLKDSSQLLPGHGGILDRLDSLGAALPFFTLAMAALHHL
ncbi:MAG: phosphatidate cytidylyltransferase [Wenzhouxiangella sp.]|jgi:phosphatidate cytidylyltransferase|nr:phosphatidate cytidylyltransferase [Wenzhouxiangella sp.]MDR9452527.1 phosphatidate cytidylyltransferase [Wenzhouxiangella sp.]